MRRVFWTLAIMVCVGSAALADPADLAGGAFIAHYEAAIEYTDSGFAGCEEYTTSYAIEDCGSQINQMPLEGGVWFVLAAWAEDKVWAGVQFGVDYTVDATYIIDYGVCGTGEVLEIPSGAWPSPQTGISLAATTDPWAGNFEPVYWFYNYAYGVDNDIVTIIPDPFGASGSGFAGCANESQVEYEFENLGAMGLATDGVAACYELPPTPGACCFAGGECQLLPEADCVSAGGDFQGVDTVCDPNPCPVTWACCYNEECYMLSQDECENDYGGTWYENEDCDSFTCPEVTVCCVDNVCYLVTQTECDALGGDFVTDPTFDSCDPNPCPVATTEASWGTIKSIYR